MKKKEYTPEEIINDLECCTWKTEKDCFDCKHYAFGGCVEALAQDALDLISKLRKENNDTRL